MILQLRMEVFIVEQNCPFMDLDGNDYDALHLLSIHDNRCVAYARIHKDKNTTDGLSLISRVMIVKDFRGKGLAYDLMNQAIEQAKICSPKADIKIAAQKRLQNFYEKCGFVYEGEDYIEDGIPHCTMYYKWTTM